MNCIMFPQNSYVEASTLNVIVFGERAVKKVRLNKVMRVMLYPYKKRKRHQDSV